MRKIACILLSVVILATTLSTSVFADDEIKVYINGEKIEFDTEPIIIDGRTFVPIRAVCEKLGADVYWDDKEELAFIIKNRIKILLFIEEDYMSVFHCNNFNEYAENRNRDKLEIESITMDVVPFIHNGRTVMPIRYVCEALDAEVLWNENTKTIDIVYNKEMMAEKNEDKEFFNKFYYYEEFGDGKTTFSNAETNEEKVQCALELIEMSISKENLRLSNYYDAEIYFGKGYYFKICNTEIYKLKKESFSYEGKPLSISNIDCVVVFHGWTDEYSDDGKGYEWDYTVTFYKNGMYGNIYGGGVNLPYLNNEGSLQYFVGDWLGKYAEKTDEDDPFELLQNFGDKYNRTLFFPGQAFILVETEEN